MGSSQSRPTSPSQPSPSAPSNTAPRPPLLARSSTLRRLSQYARGESSSASTAVGSAKRNRTAAAPSISSSTSRLDTQAPKKPRLSPPPEDLLGDTSSDVSMQTPATTHSALLSTPATISTPGLPTSPGPPIGITSMAPPTSPRGTGDPLRVERARSIASIRSVLGDNWSPPPSSTGATAASSSASVSESRFAPTPSRSSTATPTPSRARRASLPSPPSRSTGGEMTAYLGFSAPAPEPDPSPANPTSNPTSAAPATSDAAGDAAPAPMDVDVEELTTLAADMSADDIREAIDELEAERALQEGALEEQRMSIEDLERQIEETRGQIAEAREQLLEQHLRQAETARALEVATRALEAAREEQWALQRRLDAARREEAAPPATATSGGADGGMPIPTGAMLVIQGLAQTRGVRDEDNDGASSSSTNTDARPRHRRRRSEGALSRRPTRENDNHPTLEAQARMIGGLLTVAAAATASTLLAPTPRPSPRSPSITSSVVDFVMNRLRPHRPLRGAVSNIESALGNYLRGVGRTGEVDVPEHSTVDPAPSGGSATSAQDNIPAGGMSPPRAEFQRFLELMQMDLVAAVREFASPSPSESSEDDPPSEASETLPTASETTTTPPQAAEEETAVPTFHHQLGQILPSRPSTSGITGGTDGQARRLNFFRAHVFPPRHSATVAGQEDVNAVVPCVFIGVRSIAHDPSLTTDDLVRHPNFPFSDGQVPAPAPADDTTSTSGSGVTAGNSQTAGGERRSFRERVLDRLTLRRPPSQAPDSPLNTYLVYVIGGYYPRNHPVLRIPNLITGGPLSDEEMNLIAELMGPGKPPTATEEEIEKSGLRIVPGGEMKGLGERGEVLESCVERCLICLGDFEPAEECRILSCKHGFHKECVDHWLSQGRNNCPACRTEAVAKAPSAPADAAAAPPPAAEAH